MNENKADLFLTFSREIGMINQLNRALFEAHMTDGLLFSHLSILAHLRQISDGQTPQALADIFKLPKTTITHTLTVLTNRDLIEMKPNPRDGRSKRAWITAKGHNFCNEVMLTATPDIENIIADISEDTIAAMMPLLGRVRRILDESKT